MTVETKADFSRRRSVTPTAVGQWVKGGILTGKALVGAGRTARINVEEAERQLAGRLHQGQVLGRQTKAPRPRSKPAPAGEPIEDDAEIPGSPDYAREKARLAKAQADAQEMKNAQARGALVEIEVIEARWSDIFVTMRSLILALPGRVRQASPDLSAAQFAIVDTEARHILLELSRGKPV